MSDSVRYAVAVCPNMSTPNLSLADNRRVQESVKDKAGLIGFTENVGTDDKQLVAVFPPADYRITAPTSENNIVVRRARFSQATHLESDLDVARLRQFKARTWGAGNEKRSATPFVTSEGKVRARGYWLMGTAKPHVEPQRTGAFDIFQFVELPAATPGGFIALHMISAVGKAGVGDQAYRHAERVEQWSVCVDAFNALLDVGVNLYVVGDPNWTDPTVTGIRGKVHRFVTNKYAIVWFIEASTSNWTARLVAPGVVPVANPSDHDARVVSQEAVMKPHPPETDAEKVADWLAPIPTGSPDQLTAATRGRLLNIFA